MRKFSEAQFLGPPTEKMAHDGIELVIWVTETNRIGFGL